MNRLPEGFRQELLSVHEAADHTEGWLTSREIDFLTLLAAVPTAEGDILELGSFRGKSTIALAKGAALSDRARLVTVDPGASEVLHGNLERAGVAEAVEVHAAYSWDVIQQWNHPIRLLWHDGANTYDIVTKDVIDLLPYLVDSAIVAFHDVLNPSGDRVRVFMEQVLDSEHFGPVGVCGAIGWGQYRRNPCDAADYRKAKQTLRRKLQRVVPYQSAAEPWPRGLTKIRYKLLRSRVPHRRVRPQRWIGQVATSMTA